MALPWVIARRPKADEAISRSSLLIEPNRKVGHRMWNRESYEENKAELKKCRRVRRLSPKPAEIYWCLF
jgi:hypothetical protein